jgi:hypothetical protein
VVESGIDGNAELSRKFHERRKATRFKGKLAVEFEKGIGTTRDFSTSGVYFETDHSLSLAEPIEFSLILKHTDLGSPVRFLCLGKVVRVEPMVEKTGVAVAIHSYSFEEVRGPSIA